MHDQYHVDIASNARRDLRNIYNFIAKNSPQNASKMMTRLLDSMESLKQFPHRYDVPRTGYSRGRSVRAMPEPPYMIRYRINEAKKTVFVMRVRHGARRIP
jgi:toxin ParE1/3/4